MAAIVHDVLGADVMGVYLHDSAVSGGLKPNSDIDVLAVVRRPTTDAEKRLLIERLTRISRRGDPGARSIELELLVHGDVAPWRYPAPVDFRYGDWLGPEFDRGELTPQVSPDPDTALLLAAVLQADHPIMGPRPAAILEPIPSTDVRRAALDSIPQLLGWLEGDEANVTLTLARIWITVVTGDIVPKDVAADWALERLPAEHRPVLEHARTIYVPGAGRRLGRRPDVPGEATCRPRRPGGRAGSDEYRTFFWRLRDPFHRGRRGLTRCPRCLLRRRADTVSVGGHVLAGTVLGGSLPPTCKRSSTHRSGRSRTGHRRTPVAVGQAAAAAMIAARDGDGRGAEFPLRFGDGPGEYRPTPPDEALFGAAWVAGVTPVLAESAEYARECDEVKTLGALEGSTRTPEQDALVAFWVTLVGQWSAVERALATEKGLDIVEAADLGSRGG